MVRFPFYARLALTLFAIALIFAFMWVGKSVLVPLFFSFLVAILLHPLVKFFEKKRFPRALAAVTALLIFMILLGGLFYFFSHQVVRLSRDLPSLQAKVTDKWEQIQDWISDKYHITNTQQVAYVNKSATGILNSAVNSAATTFMGIAETLILTIFFFILINNLVGLIPGTANVTGNIAFTMVLALISFIVILFSSNKHYWGHIINPPVPIGVKPILIPVEILGIFTKPFALMIRLFANMIAGHIIIICLVSLIFIFGAMSKGMGWGFSPLSIAFVIFIYFIEILVAFLQAYIFTNLTAVFVGQAFEGSHNDPDHHEDIAIV